MTAQQMTLTGIVLIAIGVLLFVVSQLLLSRWHKKIVTEA